MKWGVLLRLASCWIGVHWSPYNRRLCISIVPCVTVWLVWPNGRLPTNNENELLKKQE